MLESENGVLISIKAQPGAKREAIQGMHAGMLKIAVRQNAENGKANEAIIALLAKTLHVAKSACSIRNGQRSSQKKIFIQGISAADALRCLAE